MVSNKGNLTGQQDHPDISRNKHDHRETQTHCKMNSNVTSRSVVLKYEPSDRTLNDKINFIINLDTYIIPLIITLLTHLFTP